MGAVRDCVAGEGEYPEVELAWEGEWAWEATDWRIDDASCGLGDAIPAGATAGMPPGEARRCMESIVGRRAAPKGVERKSAGRSIQRLTVRNDEINREGTDL